MEDVKQRRFLWGVALAWTPSIPIMIGVGYTFVGVNSSKATGLAALAGGFAEMYVLIGLAATLICEVGAMVLFFRSFSSGHGVRSVFSVLSICVSGLTILLFGLSLWMFWLMGHHRF